MLRVAIAITCCLVTLSLTAQEKPPRPFVPLITKEAAVQHHELVLGAIPKLDEIETIRAEQSIGVPYGHEIAPFKLPAEFIEPTMRLFEKASIDTDPILSLPEMGSLLISYKGHGRVRICIYCGAQGAPLMFSINGVRCVSTAPWKPTQGEASAQVFKLIKDAHQKVSPPKPVPLERGTKPQF